ncbi:LapA family protein [Methylibium sp.]|uniref:LapA family protein n=1 Tax=Methylibium sp. TaxID=2067992 RepID=UPI003D133D91
MNLRALAIVAVVVALVLFALLNWPAFIAPTALNLGVATVNAPLGLIMLVATGVLVGLFLVYIVFQQAGVIFEARRYAKELKAHRELADTAEASRFTELRLFLDAELRKIEAQNAAATRELGARIERLEQQLQDRLAESTRTLSAHVGEVDDKLDRLLPPSSPP